MNGLNRVIKYIQYRLKAKTKHDVHPPFLFEFITQVLNENKHKPDYNIIEDYRKILLRDSTIITCPEMGAKSKVLQTNTNSIRNIAKSSSVNKKFGQLLYRLVAHFKPKTILELGTSLGISTQYIALGNKEASVITIEGCPDKVTYNSRFMNQANFKNIKAHTGNFDAILPKVIADISTIDLAFIDGNHQELATINYFEQCLAKADNDSIFIFDDIHWSTGMEKAWKKIMTHPKVTLSIDLFFMGIIFFRKENSKEHFEIRF